MSRERFQRVAEIFRDASVLEGAERDRLLAEQCAGDAELRREVEELLAQESRLSPALRDDGLEERASRRAADALSGFRSPSALPRRIGEFEIVSLIGVGGMGVVYRARQRHPERFVALKVMQPFAAGPEPLARFEQESQLLGRLRHPGIAQVYASGVHQGEDGAVPYIAMELVEGAPITEFAAQRALSRRDRLALMIRVCAAVQHAHEHGIVHRDLKPSNVLVEDDGACGWPRLVDFGIARAADGIGNSAGAGATDAPRSRAMHTRTGQLVGTLRYMSPEQAAGGGAAPVDARSDVYALGALLYELVAQRPPLLLDELPLDEAVRMIRCVDPPSLGAVDRESRGDLSTIVGKAMEKDPDRRYASVTEFRTDLERMLRDEPILAHPPSAIYQARKFARRNRAVVVGASVVVAVLAVSTVVAVTLAIRAMDARAEAEEHASDVHQLARTLIFDLDAALMDVPGALPARRLLVERGLRMLDKLAERAADDERLRGDVAAGYVRIGDLQAGQQRPNLGDLAGGAASYSRAIEILEPTLDTAPLPQRRTHFAAHLQRADARLGQGHTVEATADFERAAALADGIRAVPGNDEVTAARDAANAHERLGKHLRTLGRGEEALRHLEEADRLTAELAASHPDRADVKRDLAVLRFRHGLESMSRSPEQALVHFREFLRLSEELSATDPESAVFLRDVAVGHQRVAAALLALGREDEAIESLRRELAIMEGLASADSHNFAALLEQASPRCKLGEVHLARREFDDARREFDRYLAIGQACIERDSASAPAQREYGVALYKLFEWHKAISEQGDRLPAERVRDRESAIQWLDRAIAHFRAMHDRGMLVPAEQGIPETLEAERAAFLEVDRTTKAAVPSTPDS